MVDSCLNSTWHCLCTQACLRLWGKHLWTHLLSARLDWHTVTRYCDLVLHCQRWLWAVWWWLQSWKRCLCSCLKTAWGVAHRRWHQTIQLTGKVTGSKRHVPVYLHERCSVDPLIVEPCWVIEWVFTGTLEAQDKPLVIWSWLQQSIRVALNRICHRSCSLSSQDLPTARLKIVFLWLNISEILWLTGCASSSTFGLAETLVKSPQKLCILTINNEIMQDQSISYSLCHFVNKITRLHVAVYVAWTNPQACVYFHCQLIKT